MSAPTCPICGTAVSTGGGRCPVCGADLPEAPGRLRAATVGLASHRARHLPSPRSSRAWIGFGVVLAILGVAAALVWRHVSRREQTTAEVLPVALPSASVPSVLPGELDALEALADTTRSARAWNPDARLLELQVFGVQLGRVQADAGGRLRAVFGVDEKTTPGKPTRGPRLTVEVGPGGKTERTDSGAGTLLREPNCTVHEAWRKAHAAGLSSAETAQLTYAWSPKLEREVWTVSAGGSQRLVDGQNCAVLGR